MHKLCVASVGVGVDMCIDFCVVGAGIGVDMGMDVDVDFLLMFC